jgi:hypothetical protein
MASVDQPNRFIFVNAPTLRSGPRDARRQLRSQLMRRVYLEKHQIPIEVKKIMQEIGDESSGDDSPRRRIKKPSALRNRAGRSQLRSTGGGQVKARKKSSNGRKASITKTSPGPLPQETGLSIIDPLWTLERSRDAPNCRQFVDQCETTAYTILTPFADPLSDFHYFIPSLRSSQDWSDLVLSQYLQSIWTPLLFHAICLGGSVHLERHLKMHNGSPPPNLAVQQAHYRYTVLRELRQVLSRPIIGTPIFDDVILSICLMAIHDPQGEIVGSDFEPEYDPFSHPLQDLGALNLYGSAIRPAHWRGLQALIQQNGGFHTLRHTETQWALGWSGICLPFYFSMLTGPGSISLKYAVNTSTKPAYPPVDHEGNYLQYSSPLKLMGIGRMPCHLKSNGFRVLQQFQIRESIVRTFLDLGDLAEGMQMLVCKRSDAATRDRIADARNAVQYRFLNLPRLNEPLSAILDFSKNQVDAEFASIALAVYKCCWLASSIFTTHITFPLPTKRRFREDLVPQLQSAIADCDPIASRRDVAQMLLWCLMIGGIAAEDVDPALRSWYVARFEELCEMLDIQTWLDVQELVRCFAWTDVACDHGGSKIWAAVGMGSSELNENVTV